MDPDACLAALLDAFREGDREASYQHLEDLLEWVSKGGFLPQDPRLATEGDMEADEHIITLATASQENLELLIDLMRKIAAKKNTPTEGS